MNESKTPLAVATFLALASLVCGLAIMLIPDLVLLWTKSITHGIEYSTIWSPGIGFSSVIVGVISAFISSYIATWVFVKVYKAIGE